MEIDNLPNSGACREMSTTESPDSLPLYSGSLARPGLVYGDEEDQANARVYLTVLGRLLEKGPEYIPGETARLKKLLGSQGVSNSESTPSGGEKATDVVVALFFLSSALTSNKGTFKLTPRFSRFFC